jgi:hypothetical protein
MAGGRAPYQKPEREWRTLEWLPGYEVSEDGDIWNGFRLLSGCLQSDGYRIYKLTRAETGKKVYKAHRLVCEAWHGPPPDGRGCVAHNDGDPNNNHHSNLRWASHQENVRDRVAHGTDASGERNPRAVLTWAQVCEVRERFAGQHGEKAALAREYSISPSAMAHILNGKHWPAEKLRQGGAKKSRVSARGRYVKGRGYEYELRDQFISYGLACRRVMQSGGGIEKDDLVLTTGWGEEWRIEAKRRAKLPGYLNNPTCHATIFRQDRGPSMVLITLERFMELVQCR